MMLMAVYELNLIASIHARDIISVAAMPAPGKNRIRSARKNQWICKISDKLNCGLLQNPVFRQFIMKGDQWQGWFFGLSFSQLL